MEVMMCVGCGSIMVRHKGDYFKNMLIHEARGSARLRHRSVGCVEVHVWR